MQQEKRRKELLNCAMIKDLFLLAVSSLFPLLWLSCSYKLGSPSLVHGDLHLQVKNDSLAPLLGGKVDRELRKQFLSHTDFSVIDNPDRADFFLVVTLTNYRDSAEAYLPDDTLLAAGLSIRVSAFAELSKANGTSIYQTEVSADSSLLRINSTNIPDDASALQALAESLAYDISVSVLNQSWEK